MILLVCMGAVAQDSKQGASGAPLDAPQPKFEPRQKFEDGPEVLSSASDLPAPGGRLDHGCVGPRGTLHLYGWQGEASFLWPTAGKPPKFYREHLVFSHAEAQGLVYRLSGRFYRVWFRVAQRADASGRHTMWIRNGDKDWALYQLVTVAPHSW
jgi:hypothetical protein